MSLNEKRLNEFFTIPFVEQGPLFDPPRLWADSLALEERDQFDLPAQSLNRVEVRAICREQKNHLLLGYLCAMAWGGQGLGRTRRHAVNAWKHRHAINDKLRHLRSDSTISRAEAYNLFQAEKSIPGLGPSYWTKLIFFFSEKEDRYIMDQWTAKSINFLYDLPVIPMNGDMPDSKKCDGGIYDKFCACIEEITAAANQRKNEDRIWTGDMIEQRLFSSGGRNPGAFRLLIKQWWSKRHPVTANSSSKRSSV